MKQQLKLILFRSNPFYDRTCNNEQLKMQKLGIADVQLQNMQVQQLYYYKNL